MPVLKTSLRQLQSCRECTDRIEQQLRIEPSVLDQICFNLREINIIFLHIYTNVKVSGKKKLDNFCKLYPAGFVLKYKLLN